MERIGIYGGTFNPPHLGHIRAAEFAISALQLDKLLLIPDHVAPHKQMPGNTASPQQRFEMLCLASRHLPRCEVSDLELRREGPSYTWQTMLQLRRIYPEAELVLLMGTDMFLSFLNWREPQTILSCASLAVLYRGTPGERQQIDTQKQLLAQQGHRVYLLENPVVDISSTQLRRMLAFDCAGDFLPTGVENYIRANALYDTGTSLNNLSLEQLEQAVLRLLAPERVRHVLGCRDAAVELARRWGADCVDAARAALLHDITKAMDGSLQLTLLRSYGIICDEFSKKYVKTLHALTGSLVAQRIFGENEAVVSAIASHTTGKPGMNTLEAIIYVADYMEPNRDFPGVERLRRLAQEDLYGALLLGLEMTMEHLTEQNAQPCPDSLDAIFWLRSRRNGNTPYQKGRDHLC